MDREEFFKKGFTYLVGQTSSYVEESKRLISNIVDQAVSDKKQRPPGSIPDEEGFKRKCTGCDKCMIACPHNVILIEDLNARYPLIYPEKDPCISCDGHPCVAACPTDALSYDNSLEPKSF